MARRSTEESCKEKFCNAAEQLLKRVETKVRASKAIGPIAPRLRRVTRFVPSEWEEKETGIHPTSWKEIEEEKADYSVAAGAIFPALTRTQEYRTLRELDQELPRPKEIFNNAIAHLLQDSIEEAVRSPRSRVRAYRKKTAQLLVDSCQGPQMEGRLLLDGLKLRLERVGIKIGDFSVSIERPSLADMTYNPQQQDRVLQGGMIVAYPTSILRVRARCLRMPEIQQATQNALCALRLMGPGRVGILDESYFVSGVWTCSCVHGLYLPYSSFCLEPADASWVKRLFPKVHEYASQGRLAEKADYLSTAYARFCGAVEPLSCEEECIMRGIMGLEALFLPSKSQGELRRTLRMRTAKLLSFIGIDADKVWENLKLGYDDRSAYAHGGAMSETDRKKRVKRYGSLSVYVKHLCEHLRLSILLFLLAGRKKDDLNGAIDRALLGTDGGELRREIRRKGRAIAQSIRYQPLPPGN